MSFSNAVVPAHAPSPSAGDTGRLSRRTLLPRIRRTLLATVASAITVGLVFAGSAPAVAAPAPSVIQTSPGSSVSAPVAASVTTKVVTAKTQVTKSKVKVGANKTSYVQGKKGAKLKIRVSVAGKKASGKVKIYDGKKLLRTVKAKKGRASYTLPKKLSAKKHTITVRFFPSHGAKKHIKSSKAKLRIKVIDRGKHIANVAKKYVGTKYRSGGTTPRGFDCSGFTSYVYKKAGVKRLPTSSSAQRHVGKVIPRSKAKAGDLIWTPGHVAIYLGGNKQIDAPRPGKTVQVRSIWQSNPKFIRV